MIKKPIIILLLGLVLFLTPLASLLWDLPGKAHPLEILLLKIYALTLKQWCIFAGYWVSAVLIQRVRVFSFYAILAFMGFLFLDNLWIAYQNNWTVLQAMAINGSVLAFLWVIFWKYVRTPYFNPKVRWWENARRYYFSMPINNKEMIAHDISTTGMFVTTKKKLDLGQSLELFFSQFDIGEIHLMGKVVRCGLGSAQDNGYGIQFSDVNSPNKKLLKRLLKQLQKSSEETR